MELTLMLMVLSMKVNEKKTVNMGKVWRLGPMVRVMKENTNSVKSTAKDNFSLLMAVLMMVNSCKMIFKEQVLIVGPMEGNM